MTEEKVINIEELTQDEHNFNKGTEGGAELMERSLKELGAGRSILIDKNGTIIAGNKTQEAAIKAGITKVRVIGQGTAAVEHHLYRAGTGVSGREMQDKLLPRRHR
jgi:hypothetical protein